MNKLNLSDFTRGMVQRISPEDYATGEWGLLRGFIPEDDRGVRSQWPIQSIGGNAEEWVAEEVTDTSHIIAVYPMRGASGTFLVALKQNGTIWWAKAPEGNATFDIANAVTWQRIIKAQNEGYEATKPAGQQPDIYLEENPDYRFVCEVPLEIYKYNKKATYQSQPVTDITAYSVTSNVVTLTINVLAYPNPFQIGDTVKITGVTAAINGYHKVTDSNTTTFKIAVTTPNASGSVSGTAAAYLPDFTKDATPDSVVVNDDAGIDTTVDYKAIPRSVVTGVLLHSRRYYNKAELTRTAELNTAFEISNVSRSSNLVTITTSTPHGLYDAALPGEEESVYVYVPEHNEISGSYYVTYINATSFSYTKNGDNITSTPVTNAYGHKRLRTQTAVICYIDPYANNGAGAIAAVTFPNIRRWPMYAADGKEPTFSKAFLPMESLVVQSNLSTDDYPFIDMYPYRDGNIKAYDFTDSTTLRSSYPKYGNVFHPYTYLDYVKVMLPGTGIIPRGNIGTMWGKQLIIGDIEWRADAASPYINEKRLDKRANTVAGASSYSTFGLRDANTEPHRNHFYYSEEEIDKFDPISVLQAGGTDTRISGMHYINNRLVVVTTHGGSGDGVISFAGNLSQLHPYTPGVLANPLAVRREVVKGGVGTADTDDAYNHGNPQTALWPDRSLVCFIDKTGYTYITDGGSCVKIDERYPLLGRPKASTVNDHVAAVGKYVFIYKNGHLFCYTQMAGNSGAWSILVQPVPYWEVTDLEANIRQYNSIRSMRGVGNELYFVVHSYYQECDENFVPLEGEEPVLAKSRVMRYAMDCEAERGMQDGYLVDGIELQTATLGNGAANKKINWHQVGVNFTVGRTDAGIVGVSVTNRHPQEDDVSLIDYNIGQMGLPNPNIDFEDGFAPLYYPYIWTAAVTTEPGNNTDYKSVQFRAGIGPSKTLTAKFRFRGDIRIDGVDVWYSGSTEAISGRSS